MREGRHQDEISLMELIYFFYCARYSILAGAVVGLLAATIYFFVAPIPTPPVQLALTIYAAGTPSYSAEEIRQQLTEALVAEGISASVSPETFIVNAVTPDAATNAKAATIAANLAKALDAQAQSGKNLLNAKADSKDALTLLLKYDAYLQGRENGYINLLASTQLEPERPNRLKIPFVIVVAGAFGGLAVHSLARLVRLWRKERGRAV